MSDDDLGNKIIGDTHTRLDLPYHCKRCGKAVKIEKRFRWAHDCIPTEKDYFQRHAGRASGAESTSTPVYVRRKPVEERYAAGYRHGGNTHRVPWWTLLKVVLAIAAIFLLAWILR